VLSAERIMTLLELRPLPGEGGFYRETYRSDEAVPAAALPDRYGGERRFGTAIYYLLTGATHSRLHRVASDEVFNFLLGDAVTMLQLDPEGAARTVRLGSDPAGGDALQVVVPRGVWQGAVLAEGGRWALMGVTVAPGFEFDDYEPADGDALARRWPDHEALIRRLASPP